MYDPTRTRQEPQTSERKKENRKPLKEKTLIESSEKVKESPLSCNHSRKKKDANRNLQSGHQSCLLQWKRQLFKNQSNHEEP
jgi:hypothetical protein